jgi:hypothetical protein
MHRVAHGHVFIWGAHCFVFLGLQAILAAPDSLSPIPWWLATAMETDKLETTTVVQRIVELLPTGTKKV